MGKRPYLTYSGFSTLQKCPLSYELRYIKKAKETDPGDPRYKILGIAWNDALEAFYKRQAYTLGGKASDWLVERTRKAFERLDESLKVVWDPGQRFEYLETAEEVASRLVSTVKREKLLTPEHEVEYSIHADLNTMGRFGGRMDLLLKRDSYEVIDFKGTRHENGKYLDEKQLLWYALLVKTKKGTLPERVGFWLLRFDAVRWMEPVPEKVDELAKEIATAFATLLGGVFEATPSWKSCKFCPYRSGCDAYTEFRKSRRKPSKLTDEDDGFSKVLNV